jgi:two-component system nitrate/nitrite response regulator NarL
MITEQRSRLLIFDRRTSFAQSLAHLLNRSGRDAAVVQTSADLAVALDAGPADACIAGLDPADVADPATIATVRHAAHHTAVIVLTPAPGPHLRPLVAAGARGVADMERGLPDLLKVLDRVCRGERVLGALRPRSGSRAPRSAAHGAHRWAGVLSPREREVLCALVRGDDTAAIARSLDITTTTARSHIQAVLTKMGTHSRLGAVHLAVAHEMVDPRTGQWVAT